MGKTIRKTRDLLAGVLRGMESTADVFTVNQYPYPHPSEQEAMRSDWKRVGNQIKKGMERVNGKAAA